MTDIVQTLAERNQRYGDFKGHAEIAQAIKRAMKNGKNWDELPESMQESLEMIAHKIGRIINGDPAYADSWHDIAGYAKLIEDEIKTGLHASVGSIDAYGMTAEKGIFGDIRLS